MGLRDHGLVIRELTFDEPCRHHEVRHLQNELILGDRDLNLFARADHAHDLGHRFARNDAGRARDALPEAPHGERQPMTVRRDHPDVFSLECEQDAVERIARLVVRHREARLREHLAQHLGLDAHPRLRRRRHHRRKIVGRQADHPIGRAAAPEGDRHVLRDLECDRGGRQLLHDLGELPRRHRDRALGGDLRRHRHPRADLQIGRGQAHAVACRLEQHVREDRQRLPRLDDVLNHLEAFEERVAVNYYFHEVLQCCLKEERNNFVVVVIVERCGRGGSARTAHTAVSSAAGEAGISVWRSRRVRWITG